MTTLDLTKLGGLATAFLLTLGSASAADVQLLKDALSFADQQYREVLQQYPLDELRYPFKTTEPEGDGSWGAGRMDAPRGWASFYYPASMWQLYHASGDAFWAEQALAWTGPVRSARLPTRANMLAVRYAEAPLEREYIIEENDDFHTDWIPAMQAFYGFNWNRGPSGRMPWEAKKNILLDFMSDFTPYVWGSLNAGSAAMWDRIHQHSLTVIERMIRQDGGTAQIVGFEYDNANEVGSADFLGEYGHQGFAGESTWSRGVGWAINGFAEIYQHLPEARFAEALDRMIDFYMRWTPANGVPYWDYSGALPEALEFFPLERDTSAATLVASGLAKYIPFIEDPVRQGEILYYLGSMLETLATPRDQGGYLAQGTSLESVITNGAYWMTHPQIYGNSGTIWGDYFFLEALNLYLSMESPAEVFAPQGFLTLADLDASFDRLWQVAWDDGEPRLWQMQKGQLNSDALDLALIEASQGMLQAELSFRVKFNMQLERETPSFWLIFGYQDTDNYQWLRFDDTAESPFVGSIAGGAIVGETSLGGVPIASNSYQDWLVQWEMDGRLRLYVEGNLMHTFAALSPVPAGAYIGLAGEDTAFYLDDLALSSELSDSELLAWRQDNFSGRFSLGISDADIDGDQLSNYLEYRLQTSPIVPSSLPKGELQTTGTMRQFVVELPSAMGSSSYVFQLSSNLVNWQNVTEEMDAHPVDGRAGWTRFSKTLQSGQFIRFYLEP